ncbi:non-oxidative hydroxyarylic acid decarboxylases subunit C [Clostridium saccharoperbutylacetonicum]|uniref:non-oxidative hydroxyarylic acid decarboxylases subunit C n=1 Tax=Clostridium saccharoperbutylacetonicum TaxID=36745 RepID=UPI000983AB79|nr:non-oxidative hydroxyarylic acid decarboxylases subunit C [Clostridium saccharoperbutylacetonicum]AQR96859.1 phenolic acid decarboxylase subunit C [Clostridium saccharoperbutylacetonicum]NSB32737.1 UbiD family decarboxylase [Clostridium saccharoperbutylacetonicum]
MSYRDLREFLDILEVEGQLVYYHDELLPEPDISAISCAAGELESGPALLLDNIIGYKGKKVAVNVHGSWTNQALMLNMPKNSTIKEQFYELTNRWDNYPGEVKWIKDAPCQEVVIDKDINLYELLPLYKVNKYDGGFYFSKACVVTKDITDMDNFDAQNVGTYRIQVQGPDTLALQTALFHDLGVHFQKAEQMNKPLPIAICLGNDPMLTFIASTPIAYDQSEYKYAAALKGTPMELVKCLTCDLDVSAYSEYVIEGEVIPGVRTVEGPFGEFPGSYSGVRKQLLIKVKKITHRKDPIYENLYIGKSWTEADTLMALNTSVPLFKQLKETMPEIEAVNAFYQHGLTTIISTDVRYGGFSKTVALKLASTPHGTAYCRNIIVVDKDVDPFNLTQVMWALSCRVRDDKDIIVIPNCPGIALNPASEIPGIDRKLILDATTPVSPDKVMSDSKMIEKSEKVSEFSKLVSNLQNDLKKH